MRNFAIFLIVGNILWWTYQLVQEHGTRQKAAVTQRSEFVQAGQRLQMLSENPVVNAPLEASESLSGNGNEVQPPLTQTPMVSNETGTASVAKPVEREPWCGEGSNWNAPEEANKFLSGWKQAGGEGDQETIQVPVSSTWWVYLPAFRNAEDAGAMLKQLQEKKIDSYYMRSGELAGGISLGVYSRKGSALTVQADLKKKGYATELKEILRMESRVRLDLKLSDRTNLESPEFRDLFKKFSKATAKEIPCR